MTNDFYDEVPELWRDGNKPEEKEEAKMPTFKQGDKVKCEIYGGMSQWVRHYFRKPRKIIEVRDDGIRVYLDFKRSKSWYENRFILVKEKVSDQFKIKFRAQLVPDKTEDGCNECVFCWLQESYCPEDDYSCTKHPRKDLHYEEVIEDE